jgi:hypothetical protein
MSTAESQERRAARNAPGTTPNAAGCAFGILLLFTSAWSLIVVLAFLTFLQQPFDWMTFLFFLPFFGIMAFLIGMTVLAGRSARASQPPPKVDASAQIIDPIATVPSLFPPPTAGTILNVRLESEDSPMAVFIGMTFAAGFWNVIMAVFIVGMAQGWLKGKGDWCLTLFLIPFTLIGLGLLAAVLYAGYQLVLSWLVRPIWLEVDAHPVRIGGEFGWLVQQTGRFTLRSANVRLLCIESATYRQGTSDTTDTKTTHTLPLPSTAEEGLPRGLFAVPADVMHSFESGHHKISWKLELTGQVLGVTYSTAFPVVLVPAGATRAVARDVPS